MSENQQRTPRISRRQARTIEAVVASVVQQHCGAGAELAQQARETLLREFDEINRRTSLAAAFWPFRR